MSKHAKQSPLTKLESEKVKQIRKRLAGYHSHKNDPYSYYENEIDAVRELRHKAPEDIQSLLSLVDRLSS